MTRIAHPRIARVLGALSLLIGITLVVPTVPLWLSEILLIPGDPVIKKIRRHQGVDDRTLAVLIDSHERALEWRERGRTWTDFGLAYFLQARHVEGAVRLALLQKARTAMINGLALAPANPYAWFRLARLHLALDGATPAAAQAVSLGLATGPYESSLLWSKLEIGLRVWDLLDTSDQATLERLILEARQRNRRRVVRLAARTGHLRLLFRATMVH